MYFFPSTLFEMLFYFFGTVELILWGFTRFQFVVPWWHYLYVFPILWSRCNINQSPRPDNILGLECWIFQQESWLELKTVCLLLLNHISHILLKLVNVAELCYEIMVFFIWYRSLFYPWPISGQCSHFIPTENIAKPSVFREHKMRILARNR